VGYGAEFAPGICVIETMDGSTVTVANLGGGLGTVGGALAGQVVFTNARSASDLAGPFGYQTVSFEFIVGFQMSCAEGTATDGKTIYVCGGGPGVGIHAGISGGVTYTVVLDVEPSK
jgi:hypothetical protein